MWREVLKKSKGVRNRGGCCVVLCRAVLCRGVSWGAVLKNQKGVGTEGDVVL